MIQETGAGMKLIFGDLRVQRMCQVFNLDMGSCLVEGDIRYMECRYEGVETIDITSFGSRGKETIAVSGPSGMVIQIGVKNANIEWRASSQVDDPITEILPGKFAVGVELMRTPDVSFCTEDGSIFDFALHTKHPEVFFTREEAAAYIMEKKFRENE